MLTRDIMHIAQVINGEEAFDGNLLLLEFSIPQVDASDPQFYLTNNRPEFIQIQAMVHSPPQITAYAEMYVPPARLSRKGEWD